MNPTRRRALNGHRPSEVGIAAAANDENQRNLTQRFPSGTEPGAAGRAEGAAEGLGLPGRGLHPTPSLYFPLFYYFFKLCPFSPFLQGRSLRPGRTNAIFFIFFFFHRNLRPGPAVVPRPSRGSLPRAAATAGLWPQPQPPPPPLRGLSRRPGGAAGGGRAARMLAAGSDMAAPSAALRQRRAAAGGGAPEAPERAVAEPADSGAGLPLPPPSGTFWLTRIVLLRSIALLYCESPGAAPRLFLSPGSGWGTRPGPAEPRAAGGGRPGVAPSLKAFPAAKPQVGPAGPLPRGRGESRPCPDRPRPWGPCRCRGPTVVGEEEARDRRRHSVVNLFAGQGAAGGCAPRSWVRAPSCHGGAAAIALSSPACLSPEHCLILGVGGAVFCVRKARGDD